MHIIIVMNNCQENIIIPRSVEATGAIQGIAKRTSLKKYTQQYVNFRRNITSAMTLAHDQMSKNNRLWATIATMKTQMKDVTDEKDAARQNLQREKAMNNAL